MNSTDYSAKIEKLNSLFDEPIFEISWPPGNEGMTLLEALEAADGASLAREHRSSFQAAQAQIAMLKCPIIAVTGELNAGKSSVTASFLSQEGRKRIPRGTEEQKGTHRFVYWAPTKWLSEPALKEAFLSLLSAVHGPNYELLSDEPTKAAEQYRSGRDNVEELHVPLIASDTELDRLGFCVLDCPDVQTKDHGRDVEKNNSRLDILARTAQICSAVLVVWERSKVRDRLLDEMLTDVRRKLPQTPIHLLINKIEPESDQPAKTRCDPDVIALIQKHSLVADGVFGAFHFRIEKSDDQPGWRELTPSALVEKFGKNGERLPQFFVISPLQSGNEPMQVGEAKFLENLPGHMNPAELQQTKISGTWSRVADEMREAIQTTESLMKARQKRAGELHDGLRDFCTALLFDPVANVPRQVLTPEFMEAFKESLEKTAPAFVWGTMQLAKPFDWMLGKAKKLVSGASDILSTLKKALNAGDTVKEVARKAATTLQNEIGSSGDADVFGCLDPDDIAAQMKSLRWVRNDADQEQLSKAWIAVFRSMRTYPVKPGSAELEKLCSSIWNSMSVWDEIAFAGKNLLKGVGALAATISAICAVIDGGAMFFSVNWLAAAIPTKMLFVSAAGGALTAAGAEIFLKSVEANTLPYLAQMFAFAADVFGIPRDVPGCSKKVSFKIGKTTHEYELPLFSWPEQPCMVRLESLVLLKGTSRLDSIKQLISQP